VYARGAQFLPYARVARLLSDLRGAPVSTGFAHSVVAEAAKRLSPFCSHLTAALHVEKVLHADETPARVGGGFKYVHVACTETLTLFHVGGRSAADIDAGGVLPGFDGVIVRDGYAAYAHLDDADHAWCGAHLIRDLRGVHETDPAGQEWAEHMANILLMAKQLTEQAVAEGRDALSEAEVSQIRAGYAGAIAKGRAANPPDRGGGLSRAGKLVERFAAHREMILRFTVDLAVPFTNNQAERDLRPVKLQQKISAAWRTLQGLADFAVLRSYLSTAAKHGMDALDVLKQLSGRRDPVSGWSCRVRVSGSRGVCGGGGAGSAAALVADLSAALPDHGVEAFAGWRAGQFGEDFTAGHLGGRHSTAVVAEDLDLSVGPVDLDVVHAPIVVLAQRVDVDGVLLQHFRDGGEGNQSADAPHLLLKPARLDPRWAPATGRPVTLGPARRDRPVQAVRVPTHSAIAGPGQRQASTQLAGGATGQRRDEPGHQRDRVGRFGVERVRVQKRPVDEHQSAGDALIGQPPQQAPEQPRPVPVGQDMPGVVEEVGAEPRVGVRSQRHNRVRPPGQPHSTTMQLQAIDDARRRSRSRLPAHLHLLSHKPADHCHYSTRRRGRQSNCHVLLREAEAVLCTPESAFTPGRVSGRESNVAASGLPAEAQ